MNWLNYQHLLYFWAVAKDGSVAAACRRLHLAQPTISGQLRTLERALGQRLFERRGRGLALTETGRIAFRYADEIFSLGSELLDAVHGRPRSGGVHLRVGVADVLPKLIVYRLLLPVLQMRERVRLICYEGKTADLISRLLAHDLDVVLADTPLPPQSGVRAFSHRLGESSLMAFATRALAAKHRRGFPRSLDGAPVLLATQNTVVRRAVDHWFESRGIRPAIVAEFEDSALLKVFGQSGAGLFLAPAAIEREIRAQYGVHRIGLLTGLREQFYAISMERRITHPAVAVLTEAARLRLTGPT